MAYLVYCMMKIVVYWGGGLLHKMINLEMHLPAVFLCVLAF